MHHAFLRTDPAQLRITRERAPESAHVTFDRCERATDNERLKQSHRRDAQVGASTNRKGEAASFERRMISKHSNVRRRIVGIGVHRIGAVERVTRRKPKIDDFKAYDACVQHCA